MSLPRLLPTLRSPSLLHRSPVFPFRRFTPTSTAYMIASHPQLESLMRLRLIHSDGVHIMRQNESMDNLEANMEGVPPQDKSKKRQQEQTEEEDKPKCRRTSVAYLHATSFTWYAQDPRWVADAPKRQRSNAKQLVALMKLFVAGDLN
ncbi:hypothetical protein PR001_g10535 [Phytophthora rubi]|uniref:Uncharacterized protein n=1 Tax=Phytophthora rubi TaxID=129364 RepID=A0A6A3MJ07_9STRA|nr:hypothetical protein PR001_g10535 [Phytophthora rubi]